MPYEQLTQKHLNNLKRKIQTQMSAKNLDNTGSASASLEVIETSLLGNDYFYYLEHGRKPGKFPPVDKIRKWVASKLGLTGKDVNSVAFLVGRKIANEGTAIFNNKSLGLELDPMIEETLNEFYLELPELMKVEFLKFTE